MEAYSNPNLTSFPLGSKVKLPEGAMLGVGVEQTNYPKILLGGFDRDRAVMLKLLAEQGISLKDLYSDNRQEYMDRLNEVVRKLDEERH